MKQLTPRLTILGAGPGDPDLFTLKGVKVLQEADVVLYDALANEELLNYAPQAEKIFVGKRKGCYRFLQESIHELIVAKAKSKGHVVRLKGGDPFVFGRGAEEMEYAMNHGLSVDVVPGISSALAVPAMQHIPMTMRGASESFWVITGTTKDHLLSEDVNLAAQSTATVVILMGMSKLTQIAELYQSFDKAETPVSVIMNGTTAQERAVTGTMNTIVSQVAEAGLSNPAIIIIGDVVKQQEKLAKINAQVVDSLA